MFCFLTALCLYSVLGKTQMRSDQITTILFHTFFVYFSSLLS